MNLLRSLLFALGLLLLTPPFSLIALATFPLPPLTRYRIITGWGRIVMWMTREVLGIHYRVEGLENLRGQPAVILSKHQSAWETIAFQSILPPHVLVLKRELLWIPFFGWGLALMSPIAINRSRGIRALKQMAENGKTRLTQGFWVVIFPEGTRTAPGKRGKYHIGGAWLAERIQSPVVPIAHNAGLCWPRNAFIKRPGMITVQIGPAINPEGLTADALNAKVEGWIESRMESLCPK